MEINYFGEAAMGSVVGVLLAGVTVELFGIDVWWGGFAIMVASGLVVGSTVGTFLEMKRGCHKE